MTKKPYTRPTITERPAMDLLCENEDCDHEATVRYRFPWGKEGVVCDDHLVITQQLATQQLNCALAVAPLVSAPAPATPPDESPELRFAKAKLLEQEQQIHELEQRVRDLTAELGKHVPLSEL